MWVLMSHGQFQLITCHAISVALGKGFWQVFIAVGLTMWVEVARIVRGQVMSIKNRQYVIATQVLGFSSFRLFLVTSSQCFWTIGSNYCFQFAAAILIESGLSFWDRCSTAHTELGHND
ncbi:MAG: hypothetical protein CM15mP83_3990 [Flavobacteriaceae bacterium]|nr:MAG: hypothetical protein CM15mP83_3990 [Flavobacteriaceae bacterium]